MNGVVDRVIDAVRPRYTLTSPEALESVVTLTLHAIDTEIPGDLVECGTWMGGCSFAMLLAQRYAYGEIRRPVWMYDSFEGMSPPSPEDGSHAAKWYETAETLPKDRASNEWCIAPLEAVREHIAELKLEGYALLRPGWLADTLPKNKPRQIALLRIDCDWYDPVKAVWEELEPNVSPGAPIIIDDYYAWEGATLATHEYLSTHKLPWPISSIPGLHGAVTLKGRRQW